MWNQSIRKELIVISFQSMVPVLLYFLVEQKNSKFDHTFSTNETYSYTEWNK